MRWVAFFCFLPFSTAALALDDCNAKFPSTSQLEERLKCLQLNNNSLQSQIDALKTGSSNEHAIARPEAKPVAKPVAKPIAKPAAAKPVAKGHVTTPQPLTKADCKKLVCNGIAMPTCAVGRPSASLGTVPCGLF
jgi:hypothetical protein